MAEPMKPVCEHHYASYVRGGLALCVRICMLCGAVDFDDLAEQAAAVRAAALREAAAAYDAYLLAGGDPNVPCTWLRVRADRIEQEAADAR